MLVCWKHQVNRFACWFSYTALIHFARRHQRVEIKTIGDSIETNWQRSHWMMCAVVGGPLAMRRSLKYECLKLTIDICYVHNLSSHLKRNVVLFWS